MITGGKSNMLNQCILVGKVTEISEDKATITLCINRNYKEPGDDYYKEDEIDIELSSHLKETALQYVSVGATLGVKARIAQRVANVGDTEIKMHAIVAEKLTFINSNKDE